MGFFFSIYTIFFHMSLKVIFASALFSEYFALQVGSYMYTAQRPQWPLFSPAIYCLGEKKLHESHKVWNDKWYVNIFLVSLNYSLLCCFRRVCNTCIQRIMCLLNVKPSNLTKILLHNIAHTMLAFFNGY